MNLFYIVTGTPVPVTVLSICAGGRQRALKRAHPACHQVGSGPMRFLRVRVGWSQIPHSRLLLSTRKTGELAGRPVGTLTKLPWGNLNTPHFNHHDFDKYVHRTGDWFKTKFKVNTQALTYFCCQRRKMAFVVVFRI